MFYVWVKTSNKFQTAPASLKKWICPSLFPYVHPDHTPSIHLFFIHSSSYSFIVPSVHRSVSFERILSPIKFLFIEFFSFPQKIMFRFMGICFLFENFIFKKIIYFILKCYFVSWRGNAGKQTLHRLIFGCCWRTLASNRQTSSFIHSTIHSSSAHHHWPVGGSIVSTERNVKK